jgi:phospholipid/cholesterol/gamma-HCH transport system substrate-binding protein
VTPFRERSPTLVGAVTLVVLGGLFLLAFTFNRLPFVARSYALVAEFADAAGLQPGNEVRVAGLKVGRVTAVELGADRVLVRMAIDRGVRIPADATAEISLKTILGTKSVVIDARGDGPALGDGGRIPLERTSIPFEIYQVANAAVDLLSGVDGAELEGAFQALADVTADPGRNLARALEGTARLAEALAPRRQDLGALIDRGEQLLEALDRSAPDVEAVLRDVRTILEVLARRREVVRSLLRSTDALAGQLAGLLREKRPELDAILRDLHTTLAVVDASLGELARALEVLGPSSESFARVFWRGRWASVCTYAARAQALPAPLPASVSVGTGGLAGPPVDCRTPSPALPASERAARLARWEGSP